MSNQIVQYMKSDEVLQSFTQVLGNEQNAGSYISSVLIAARNNQAVMKCTPVSIYTSALRAATLRLSVDPSTKQAYLVPYGEKCTLIVGYKGLYDMAIRTGRYRYIHTSKIYEGEDIVEDRITGSIKFEGRRTGNKVVGWLAYFQMTNGFEKYVVMSVEEIHEHKQKYSKGFDRQDSAWKTSTEQMEGKTVLRNLLMNWGYLDPADSAVLGVIEYGEDEIIDAPVIEITSDNGSEERKTAEQEIEELGF